MGNLVDPRVHAPGSRNIGKRDGVQGRVTVAMSGHHSWTTLQKLLRLHSLEKLKKGHIHVLKFPKEKEIQRAEATALGKPQPPGTQLSD